MLWDNDVEIPVLYPFGSFLAKWWFNDKLKPGKPHLEQHVLDGPPLVATIGSGGAIPWPYDDSDGLSSGHEWNLYDTSNNNTYSNKIKMASDYTPVVGLYGVSDQKENSRDKRIEYYPNASKPNDYIAHRILGEHANYTHLYQMSDPKKIINKNVFKAGTPFGSAIIGPNNPDDKRWTELPKYFSSNPGYKFKVPLTSTGTGMITGVDLYTGQAAESVRDYSGMEYNQHENTNTNEFKYVYDNTSNGTRPPWYSQDQKANLISGRYMDSFPGEVDEQTFNENPTHLIPTFYDPSATEQTFGGKTFTSWGQPNGPSGMVLTPNTVQLDYIVGQLAQENPISSSSQQ